jgi:Na+-driven multidrug efflux pump
VQGIFSYQYLQLMYFHDRIALPLSVTYIAQFLITTTNLFFVGKQGTKEELAGAAFG